MADEFNTDGFKEWWSDFGKPLYDGDSQLCALRAWQLQQGRIMAMEKEIKAFETAGWRCCQDHILKPEHPCPICELERASVKADEILVLLKQLKGEV